MNNFHAFYAIARPAFIETMELTCSIALQKAYRPTKCPSLILFVLRSHLLEYIIAAVVHYHLLTSIKARKLFYPDKKESLWFSYTGS